MNRRAAKGDAGAGRPETLNEVFLGIVLVLRFASWRRPLDFFRDGWNVFDFAVVGAASVAAPPLRRHVTAAHLASPGARLGTPRLDELLEALQVRLDAAVV